MEGMETIGIGLLFTILGGVIGFLAFTKSRDKEIKCEGEKDGALTTTLNYISQGVDEIKVDVRVLAAKVDDVNVRLIRAEESTKSAHKRIDDLTGPIKPVKE